MLGMRTQAIAHSSAALDASTVEPRRTQDDYIEKNEFRLLLICMRQYFELYVAFSRLDSSLDRRLNKEEFLLAVPHLRTWGITLTPEEAEAEFKAMDDNGGGFDRSRQGESAAGRTGAATFDAAAAAPAEALVGAPSASTAS